MPNGQPPNGDRAEVDPSKTSIIVSVCVGCVCVCVCVVGLQRLQSFSVLAGL